MGECRLVYFDVCMLESEFVLHLKYSFRSQFISISGFKSDSQTAFLLKEKILLMFKFYVPLFKTFCFATLEYAERVYHHMEYVINVNVSVCYIKNATMK